MSKEFLDRQIVGIQERHPGLKILSPGDMSSVDTANCIIDLLQEMYIEHGIIKNKQNLVEAIDKGDILTWFAVSNNKFVATASLIKQADGVWELGRAVSLKRGENIGKRVILEALRFYIENHSNDILTAEVRAAAEFEGIPSGLATQKIFFGLISDILPLRPYAIAPLFAHGDPLRNEQFILSSTDIEPGKTISQRWAEAVNNSSVKGEVSPVQIIQKEPFQLIVPDEDGVSIEDVLDEVENFDGCTLFSIEATDRNMPLVEKLLKDPNMIKCGVDRVMGKENKPILLIARIGFGRHVERDGSVGYTLLAPSVISQSLSSEIRKDLQEIADKFTRKNISQRENIIR